MSSAAILQLALALLPLVQTGVTEFVSWINTLHTAASQTDEWTADQETAFRAALFAKTSDPAYAPDAPKP